MSYRHSLRVRLIVSYPIVGAVIGVLLAVLLSFALESMERLLMDAYVSDELQQFIATGGSPVLHSSHWSAYRVPAGQAPPELEFLAALAPGLHEVVHDDRTYDVGIAEQADMRYYLVFDDTAFEAREHLLTWLLIGTILVAMFTAAWFGYWLSGRVIRPIKDLASRIKIIEPETTTHLLRGDFGDDEVGDLAAAFDTYQQRLAAFMRREQEFTADASHELRSPLTVIRAASEGMLANGTLPESLRPSVERIARAAQGMSDTLGLLLLLAREGAGDAFPGGQTDLAMELEQLISSQQEALNGRTVALVLEVTARPVLTAPPAAALLVAGNLLRNALAYTATGTIRVHLDGERLLVENSGPGIPPEDLQHIFERGKRGRYVQAAGRGLGLDIAQRVCARFGWSLQLESPVDVGVRAQWRFLKG